MSIIYDDNWSLTRKQEESIIDSDARGVVLSGLKQ